MCHVYTKIHKIHFNKFVHLCLQFKFILMQNLMLYVHLQFLISF